MSFDFRVIKPIDWKELSDFFLRNWHGKYHYKVGAFEWNVNYTKWIISQHLWDENLLFGMYEGSKLIGLMFGCPQNLILNTESERTIQLKGISMAYQTIDVKYRKRGLLHKLMPSYIKHVKSLGYDLITSFAIQRWENFLERYKFKYMHKDPQIYVKFLSNAGVDKIREIRGLNRALALLAKTLAGIPDEKLAYGKIVDGTSNDAGRIVALLNSYNDKLSLSPIWKVDDLTSAVIMKRFVRLIKRGLPRSAALRQAQLYIRNNVEINPLYWAAFYLTGDFR